MTAVEIGLFSVLGVLILVYAGVHIGVALGLLSFACIWAVRGDFTIAGKMLTLAAAESLAQYDFATGRTVRFRAQSLLSPCRRKRPATALSRPVPAECHLLRHHLGQDGVR